MYPHERSLVERLADEPFAIVGVNSDRDREKLLARMEEERITWRSFWNGGGTSGPISTRWNVQGWPTLYLLDHEGTIREKWIGSPGEERLDGAIDALLEEAREAAKDEEQARAELEEIVEEYDVAQQAFSEGYGALETEKERSAFAQEHYPRPADYARRLFALAEQHAGTEAAGDALVWIVEHDWGRDAVDAFAMLVESHVERAGLADLAWRLDQHPRAMRPLERLHAESPHALVRGRALLSLARAHGAASREARRLQDDEGEPLSPGAVEFLGGEAFVAELRAADPDALARRSEELLERVRAEYDEEYPELAKSAAGDLFELRHLQVGMTAPDIEGVDLDGQPMKLSDYRGRVVVLDFWGDW